MLLFVILLIFNLFTFSVFLKKHTNPNFQLLLPQLLIVNFKLLIFAFDLPFSTFNI